MSIENAIYEELDSAIENAENTSALFDAELHDTLYARVTKPFGVRIGDVDAELAPSAGGAEVEEFNAGLPIQCFARVQGDTASARAAARNKVTAIAHEVANIFFNDPTLTGKVRDAIVIGVERGWAQVQAAPYAVAVLSVLVNGTGQQFE